MKMTLEILIRKGRVRSLSDDAILNGIRFHYDAYVAFIKEEEIEWLWSDGQWLEVTSPMFLEDTVYRIKPVEEKVYSGWENIPSHINYIAKDYFDNWWGFVEHPEYDEYWGTWVSDEGTALPIPKSEVPEDVKFKYVIVKRPL